MTDNIVQHPSVPRPPIEDHSPEDPIFPEDYVDAAWADDVEDEARELIAMLKHEIGLRWMSFALRLQIEKLEALITVDREPDTDD